MKNEKRAPKKQVPAQPTPPKKWYQKLKTWHWAVAITLAFVVLLVSTVGIWWACADVESFKEGWSLVCNLFDEPDNDVFYKDSYTVSDKKAEKWGDKVVAKVGDKELTNSMLQVYYWMNTFDSLSNNGQYLMAQGLDYSKPLDEQYYDEYGGTWQQFFLDDALRNWHNYQAMGLLAEQAGLELSDAMKSDLQNLRLNLAQSASSAGFPSIDAMLKNDMGAGCTYGAYEAYMRTYYTGYLYFEAEYDKASAAITEEVLEEYFNTNKDKLAENKITKESGNYYSVRHILIVPEGGNKDSSGKITYSEEEWEECRKAAQKILDDFLAGDVTETAFAVLANKNSDDTGSNANGGLYENLTKDDNFVEPFKKWYLDETRKSGDTGLIKTEWGYHVMYFVQGEPQWKTISRNRILSSAVEDIVKIAREQFPIEVTYKNIVLGYVDLTGGK